MRLRFPRHRPLPPAVIVTVLAGLTGLGVTAVAGMWVVSHGQGGNGVPGPALSKALAADTAAQGTWSTRPRGAILDRSGTILAMSEKRMMAFARPHRLSDAAAAATSIAGVLGLDADKVAQRLARSRNFVWLAHDLSQPQGEALAALGIPGVSLCEAFSRVYPYGTLGAAFLGFVGPEGRGLEGIECTHDTQLQGGSGRGDLRLTIERGLQAKAERELDAQIAQLRAERGCLLVMDVHLGEILAMTSRPVWDPKHFWEAGDQPVNRAIKDDVDPAPLLAVLALAVEETSAPEVSQSPGPLKAEPEDGPGKAALVTGVPVPQDAEAVVEAEADWGWARPGDGLALWGPWGEGRLASLGLGADLPPLLSALGLGQATGIDLPGEPSGCLSAGFGEAATISAIHGLRASPIQLLVAFAALIGDGQVVRPHLVLEGERVREWAHRDQAAISPALAERVRGWLAVESGPSLGGYRCSGDEGPSETDHAQVSLLGFWPPDSPRVAYVMVLDGVRSDPRLHGQGLGHVLSLAQAALRLPMGENGSSMALRAGGGVKDVSLAVKKTEDRQRGLSTMPALYGQSMRKALETVQHLRLPVLLQGRGVVVEQVPSPGTPVGRIKECRLRFEER